MKKFFAFVFLFLIATIPAFSQCYYCQAHHSDLIFNCCDIVQVTITGAWCSCGDYTYYKCDNQGEAWMVCSDWTGQWGCGSMYNYTIWGLEWCDMAEEEGDPLESPLGTQKAVVWIKSDLTDKNKSGQVVMGQLNFYFLTDAQGRVVRSELLTPSENGSVLAKHTPKIHAKLPANFNGVVTAIYAPADPRISITKSDVILLK